MKLLKFSAPSYSEADEWYIKEQEFQTCINVFESKCEELEVGEKLVFEVELLELTDKQWETLQEDFVEE